MKKKNPPICPRCRGKVAYYNESWTASIEFDADRNGWPIVEPDQYAARNCNAGDPVNVEAVCGRCGHYWKLRKVTQITDVSGD